MNTSGWCYFKRGVVGHRGKYHFIPEGENKSRCGQWIVRPEEWKYIIFIDKEKLRKKKICKTCEIFLIKNIYTQNE
jgi:hypothetical protein